jgi:hypothetical protein
MMFEAIIEGLCVSKNESLAIEIYTNKGGIWYKIRPWNDMITMKMWGAAIKTRSYVLEKLIRVHMVILGGQEAIEISCMCKFIFFVFCLFTKFYSMLYIAW